MAQQEKVLLVDDIDGGAAQETVRFALDGQDYEIDLDERNAGELRALLGRYAARARRKSPRPARRKRDGAREDLPDIRDYARSRGYAVEDKGRVARRIIDEYDVLKRLSIIG